MKASKLVYPGETLKCIETKLVPNSENIYRWEGWKFPLWHAHKTADSFMVAWNKTWQLLFLSITYEYYRETGVMFIPISRQINILLNEIL